MMAIKTLVFVSNQHGEETGIDFHRPHGKPPAPIRRRECPHNKMPLRSTAVCDPCFARSRSTGPDRGEKTTKAAARLSSTEVRKMPATGPKCFT
jgi:hypothetical protein